MLPSHVESMNRRELLLRIITQELIKLLKKSRRVYAGLFLAVHCTFGERSSLDKKMRAELIEIEVFGRNRVMFCHEIEVF